MKPRRRRSHQYHGSSLSFIDMLFNINMLFVLLFFAAILLMNPAAKNKDVEVKSDIMIVMTWPDADPNDIDLWIKAPPNDIIGYPHKENSYLHLERDDTGASSNYIITGDTKVDLGSRREVIMFRGKTDGRFVVNVHFYSAKDKTGSVIYDKISPVPVHIELIQINPEYKIVAKKDITLAAVKQEETAFSFLIQEGNITQVNTDISEPFISEYSPGSGEFGNGPGEPQR